MGKNTPSQNTVTMTTEQQLKAEIERLKAENERLNAAKIANRPFGIKKSDKGAVSVYGLGKFPTTLYMEQWLTLIANIDKVKEFIKVHKDELAVKEQKAS